MSALHFDLHQFQSRGKFPVSAESKIAFEDFSRMHSEYRGKNPTSFVPPFALNDKQLQAVLLRRAWAYVRHGPNVFPDNASREEINRAATAKALKGYAIRENAAPIQHEMRDKHIAAVRRAGGYMELLAAIAFRAWRLGQDSVAVGDSLGMTPWTVRVHLWRLRDVAKKLGFDVGRAGYTAGMTRSSRINMEQAVEMYNNGLSIRQIALQVGYTGYYSGNSRIRQLLVAAGIELRAKKKPGQDGPDAQ